MSSTDSFSIPKGFAKVILVVAGMNLQMFAQGMRVSKMRAKIFNKEFMDKHFGETHQKELKEEIQRGGAPDMGSGIYSEKLSYR